MTREQRTDNRTIIGLINFVENIVAAISPTYRQPVESEYYKCLVPRGVNTLLEAATGRRCRQTMVKDRFVNRLLSCTMEDTRWTAAIELADEDGKTRYPAIRCGQLYQVLRAMRPSGQVRLSTLQRQATCLADDITTQRDGKKVASFPVYFHGKYDSSELRYMDRMKSVPENSGIMSRFDIRRG